MNIDVTIKEAMRLVSACNSAILADERTLANIGYNNERVANLIRESIQEYRDLKYKIMLAALPNREEVRE